MTKKALQLLGEDDSLKSAHVSTPSPNPAAMTELRLFFKSHKATGLGRIEKETTATKLWNLKSRCAGGKQCFKPENLGS